MTAERAPGADRRRGMLRHRATRDDPATASDGRRRRSGRRLEPPRPVPALLRPPTIEGADRRLFPAGVTLVLDDGVRRIDRGQALVGGSPLRVLRLTAAGVRTVDLLAAGFGIPDSAAARRLARRLIDAGMAHPQTRTLATGFSPADVTVVIPVLDRPEGLAASLAHLGPVGATVVVDDGSTPEAAAALARLAGAAGATLVRHDRRRGPGAARNRGVEAVTTPLVAFLDTDCEAAPGWLEGLLGHFVDPALAAVAPRIRALPSREGEPSWVREYDTVRSPLDLGARPAPVRPRSVVPFVPSTALLVRREALGDVGGFDEALHWGEDVDLIWRLHERGWAVRYEPAVSVGHPVRTSTRGWLVQRFRYGTAAAPLARRHPGATAPVSVSAWSAAAWGLTGLGHARAGLALAAGTTARLAPGLRSLGHPWWEAGRLAGRGHLRAGTALSEAVRRTWWPVGLLVALRWRRGRRAVVTAVVVPAVIEWRTRRPRLGLAKWTAVHLADDVAYGAGVWAGCVRERSLAALKPDLTGLPALDEIPTLPPVRRLRRLARRLRRQRSGTSSSGTNEA